MPELNVIVRGKIAQGVKGQYAVCENSDYTVKFDFDDDWRSQKYKTARFIWNDKYEDVVFEGDECSLPIVSDTYCLKVGVFAGDLQTTTPAIIVMKKSILCGSATAEKPSEDVYSQIMALLNDLKELSGEELAAAIEKYLTEHPIGGGAATAEDISYTLSEDIQNEFPKLADIESNTVKDGLDVAMFYAFAGMFAKYIQCDVQAATGTITVDLQSVMDGWHPVLEQAHEHDNKSVLDKFDESKDGKPTYSGKEIGGAGDFIVRMTIEVNGDNYTVTSCDKTMEQIDAAVVSGQNIKAIAFDQYILPLVQMQYGESYVFCAAFSSLIVMATVTKYPEPGANAWQFYLVSIAAEDVGYSNAALPHISTVGGALDKLVPKSYTHATGSNIALADNTEYRLTNVTTLTLTYPTGDFECWMRLTFAASGDITVTLPTGTRYIGTAPDFKNGETWELSFKDKILAAQKVGDGT